MSCQKIGRPLRCLTVYFQRLNRDAGAVAIFISAAYHAGRECFPAILLWKKELMVDFNHERT